MANWKLVIFLSCAVNAILLVIIFVKGFDKASSPVPVNIADVARVSSQVSITDAEHIGAPVQPLNMAVEVAGTAQLPIVLHKAPRLTTGAVAWALPVSQDKYNEYIGHQKKKLDQRYKKIVHYDKDVELMVHADISRHERANRLKLKGQRVLCIGARLGGEVRAFKEHGAFAVGIDLNPGPDNHHVIAGDGHLLEFPDASVDVVFTSVLDHILDLDRLLAEIVRVCAIRCQFHVLLYDQVAGGYEVRDYKDPSFLLPKIDKFGFKLQANLYTEMDLPPPSPVPKFWDLLFLKQPSPDYLS